VRTAPDASSSLYVAGQSAAPHSGSAYRPLMDEHGAPPRVIARPQPSGGGSGGAPQAPPVYSSRGAGGASAGSGSGSGGAPRVLSGASAGLPGGGALRGSLAGMPRPSDPAANGGVLPRVLTRGAPPPSASASASSANAYAAAPQPPQPLPAARAPPPAAAAAPPPPHAHPSSSSSASSGGAPSPAALAAGLPLTAASVLKHHRDSLSEFEQSEVLEYPAIWYTGAGAAKIRGVPGLPGPSNHGYDDERGDYVSVPHDHLGFRYEVLSLLGKGSFGAVLRCFDHKTQTLRAVKIIRNKKRFHHQALVEVKILEHLRARDPGDGSNMVHMHEYFYFRSHLCIAFELLSINLYEFIKNNNFQGLSIGLIRRFAQQLLVSLRFLRAARVIHCDLKPENILLRAPNKSGIKVIDFGSSCFEEERVYTYIQSRFYRSPEVILGLPYDVGIDMWSLGCILAELYTGYPLFPGENETEQLACIMESLGLPPRALLEPAARRKQFFDSAGAPRLVANSRGKRRRPGTKELGLALRCSDAGFVAFLQGCLRWDPRERLSPDAALAHEWICDGALPPPPPLPPPGAAPQSSSSSSSSHRGGTAPSASNNAAPGVPGLYGASSGGGGGSSASAAAAAAAAARVSAHRAAQQQQPLQHSSHHAQQAPSAAQHALPSLAIYGAPARGAPAAHGGGVEPPRQVPPGYPGAPAYGGSHHSQQQQPPAVYASQHASGALTDRAHHRPAPSAGGGVLAALADVRAMFPPLAPLAPAGSRSRRC
jgi:dual specificity tyrosine-phosphorylation-regulated kinase 2/3/4